MKRKTFLIITLIFFVAACLDAGSNTSAHKRNAESEIQDSSSSESDSGKRGWLPSAACSFMEPTLSTRGYKQDSGDEFYCSSPYMDIGKSGLNLANNLAYYVTGGEAKANKVKLVLNYNQPSNSEPATNELVSASRALSLKATGYELPDGIQSALFSSHSLIDDYRGFRHEVKRDDWPAGKGYEIHYIITPSSDIDSEWDRLNQESMDLYKSGKHEQAVLVTQQALQLAEQVFGQEHPYVATSLNNLAVLKQRSGEYSAAKSIYARSLAIRQRVFGGEHYSSAESMNNLGDLYRTLGNYAEAEPLLNKSLVINEKLYGSDSLYLTPGLNNLARLYGEQGMHEKAEKLYKRSLEIREKTLGLDHPDVATALSSLGVLYLNLGYYDKAEPFLERALEIREKKLDAEHPDLASSFNNLAGLYHSKGMYSKAEPLYERSLLIWERTLGPEHPYVAAALTNLSFVYRSTSRESEAEEFAVRAANIRAIER